MTPAITTAELERALRELLPPDHAGRADELARAIAGAAQGGARLDPALAPALRALAGAEVRSGGVRISFGTGNQIGSLTIGDLVGGDLIKLTVQLPPFQLTPHERRNRRAMLQKVRATWVDGLLTATFAESPRIALGIAERPGAARQPLDAQYQELRRAPRDLPPEAAALDRFDASGGSLLILGAPGAGKTTLLLELCRGLLERAAADEAQPIPVVLNLSSWAARREPLDRWIVEELRTKYAVPAKIARAWAGADALLPLLDGLDEVAAPHREACAAAINAYRQNHLGQLAVCAREADYELLGVKLQLHTTLLVRPVRQEQADSYLGAAAPQLAGLQALLDQDPDLRALAATPLMLNVIRLVGVQMPRSDPPATAPQAIIWQAYIQAMLRRRGEVAPAERRRMLTALQRIARTMLRDSQTILLVERLQPGRLGSRWAVSLYWVCSLALILAIPMALMLALGGLVGGLASMVVNLRMDNLSGVDAWLFLGGMGGIISWLALVITGVPGKAFLAEIEPFESIHFSWRSVVPGLLAWFLVAGWGYWSGQPLIGAGLGLLLGYIFVIGIGASGREIPATTRPNEGMRRALRSAALVTLAAGLPAAGMGLAASLIMAEGLVGGAALALIGSGMGVGVGVAKGGGSAIKHCVLRLMLALTRRLPLRLVPLLEACAGRGMLRRVGGGYIFTHRLLMEHIAALGDAEISALSADRL